MGLKRGISMDFEKANQGKGNIDYKSGLTAFRVNCQSSVVAHELRMRGFDVTAQPNLQKGDDPNRSACIRKQGISIYRISNRDAAYPKKVIQLIKRYKKAQKR